MTVGELIEKLQALPQRDLVLVYSPYDDAWIGADVRTEIIAVKLPQNEQQPYDTYQVWDNNHETDMIVLNDGESFVSAVSIW